MKITISIPSIVAEDISISVPASKLVEAKQAKSVPKKSKATASPKAPPLSKSAKKKNDLAELDSKIVALVRAGKINTVTALSRKLKVNQPKISRRMVKLLESGEVKANGRIYE